MCYYLLPIATICYDLLLFTTIGYYVLLCVVICNYFCSVLLFAVVFFWLLLSASIYCYLRLFTTIWYYILLLLLTNTYHYLLTTRAARHKTNHTPQYNSETCVAQPQSSPTQPQMMTFIQSWWLFRKFHWCHTHPHTPVQFRNMCCLTPIVANPTPNNDFSRKFGSPCVPPMMFIFGFAMVPHPQAKHNNLNSLDVFKKSTHVVLKKNAWFSFSWNVLFISFVYTFIEEMHAFL